MENCLNIYNVFIEFLVAPLVCCEARFNQLGRRVLGGTEPPFRLNLHKGGHLWPDIGKHHETNGLKCITILVTTIQRWWCLLEKILSYYYCRPNDVLVYFLDAFFFLCIL